MGYPTVFWGRVAIAPALDRDERDQLERFAAIRHDGSALPSVWCHWVSTKDGGALSWDGSPNFSFANDWMRYLIEQFLRPGGHRCDGTVFALARPESVVFDAWRMDVRDNRVTVHDYGVPIAELGDDQLDDHEGELDVLEAFQAAMADQPGGVVAVVACLRLLGDFGQATTADGLRVFATELAAIHPRPETFRAAFE